MGLFKVLSYLSVGSIYTLIVIGGYVSSLGAGLACPDWPLCHGQIIPPLTFPIVVEYTHRLFTVLASFFVFGTLFAAWKSHRSDAKALIASTVLGGMLVAQIIMGMLTVQSSLEPAVVTAHLALAIAIFGIALITAVVARSSPGTD